MAASIGETHPDRRMKRMNSMSRAWACLALCWCAGGAVQAAPPRSSPPASAPAPTPAPSIVPSPPASPDGAASAPVSMSARRVYEQARSQLLQIRTVLKGRASQTSVGSGFLVTREGHIITNFHVVSEVALEPATHDLVYVTADGREAKLNILMLDVLHDLALVKVTDVPPAPAQSASAAAPVKEVAAKDTPAFDALSFRPANKALGQGERMYSLGNPLDVGFAVIEGNYNGLVER